LINPIRINIVIAYHKSLPGIPCATYKAAKVKYLRNVFSDKAGNDRCFKELELMNNN